MLYRLRFIDTRECVVLVNEIEATNDESAVELSCSRCIGADMPVELYQEDRHIMRMTPMTARLYLAVTTDLPR